MTRISKVAERRARSPRKRKYSLAVKTGPKKEKVAFKNHTNAITGELSKLMYIPKIS